MLPVIVAVLFGCFASATEPHDAPDLVAAAARAETATIPEVNSSLNRGIQYLLKSQHADGSWGGAQWTGGVDSDPVPGAFHSFSVAVAALCLEALLDAPDSPEIIAVRSRAEHGLLPRLEDVRRADPGNLPNVWANCYAIQTLVRLHALTPIEDLERRAKLERLIRVQLNGLKRFETVNGGWFYYASGLQHPDAPSCSFVDAAVLVAMHRSHGIGVDPDPGVRDRAIAMLLTMKKPDFSYLYSLTTPLERRHAMAEINRTAGSLGRSQACNLALRMWRPEIVDDAVLEEWLARLITRQGWLDMGRKRPIPHESHAAVAGYFYYFGHYYAGLTLDELPHARREIYASRLARIMLDRQESDGSWFDYPLYSYHQAYGTAFAVMTLERCRSAMEPSRPQDAQSGTEPSVDN